MNWNSFFQDMPHPMYSHAETITSHTRHNTEGLKVLRITTCHLVVLILNSNLVVPSECLRKARNSVNERSHILHSMTVDKMRYLRTIKLKKISSKECGKR